MAADQAANLCLRASRKATGQEDHRSECAGFAIDRDFGSIEVAPHLKNREYDEQSEDRPQGTQQSGGRAFENAGPLASAEQDDDRENHARDQIDDSEYH